MKQSQTAFGTTDRGGGGKRGKKNREASISKVESQSLITRPALICLENVTGLSGGGGGVTFQFTTHFTSHFLLAGDDGHYRGMKLMGISVLVLFGLLCLFVAANSLFLSKCASFSHDGIYVVKVGNTE